MELDAVLHWDVTYFHTKMDLDSQGHIDVWVDVFDYLDLIDYNYFRVEVDLSQNSTQN